MRQNKNRMLIIAILTVLALNAAITIATPVGPTIVYNFSETASPTGAALINTTGGSITTMVLNATSQNPRWKAYVGNVSGALTLDDANNQTIFDWSLSNVVGEIYATRSSNTLSWANVNCSNLTHIYNEEAAMNHTNPYDNISATFDVKLHNAFYIGTNHISQNTCYSVHTYVNSTNQSTDFQEMLLYDGTNSTNGNVIYAATLENSRMGFDNNQYDFQMIVPENGITGFTSSTAYYFYVELT